MIPSSTSVRTLFPFRNSNGGVNWTFLSLAGMLVAARIIFYQMTWFTTDDAFITYRYARNIASGLGFVYNVGEHVQGTSSPLYAMYLAAFGAIFGTSSIPMLSRLTAIIADVITLSVLWSMFTGHGEKLRILILVIFALYPKIVLIAISGMEAPVVVMLMLLVWRWYSLGRVDLAVLASACLLLTRLDTFLWVLLIGVAVFLRHKSVPWKPAFIAGLFIGAWIGFCYWYFGSWIPNSVTAKNVAWNHLFPAFDPVRIMAGYLPSDLGSSMAAPGLAILMVVLMLPVLLEGFLCMREKSDKLIFPVFFIAYNLAFSFGRVLMPDWYYYPGYIVYIITCGYLIARIIPAVCALLPVRLRFVTSLILLMLFFGLGAAYKAGATRWADNPGGLFLRQNDALGLWLKDNAHPASHVLIEPIGYVGWESNLYIDDYIGLVSPQVVDYRKHSFLSDRWYMAYIKDRTPDYIVQRNWEHTRNMLFHGYGEGMFIEPDDREWFDKHYLPVNWNPRAGERDSLYLVLFERTDTTPLFGDLTPREIAR